MTKECNVLAKKINSTDQNSQNKGASEHTLIYFIFPQIFEKLTTTPNQITWLLRHRYYDPTVDTPFISLNSKCTRHATVNSKKKVIDKSVCSIKYCR